MDERGTGRGARLANRRQVEELSGHWGERMLFDRLHALARRHLDFGADLGLERGEATEAADLLGEQGQERGCS